MGEHKMTLETIIAVIAVIASFLGSILIIWNFTSKVKKSVNDSVTKLIKDNQKENDEAIDRRIACSGDSTQKIISASIKALEDKFTEFIEIQKETNRLDYESIKLLKESLVEAYKQDIRTIYYRLRDTGEITDHDKSYVDKLFPKYVALGGNSDIEAKYAEMCRVYETITQENFEKARAKAKKKKEKEEAKKLAEEKANQEGE